MKRSIISLIGILTFFSIGLIASSAIAIDGPLANAIVSFGQWKTPLDRFPINSPAGPNNHELIPNIATIKAGGAVNFIISGLHQPIVYSDGTQPIDINIGSTVNSTGTPNNVALINDSNDRIYRGLDPSRLHLVDPVAGNPSIGVRDRVEVVLFSEPGTYLVICGVRNHFFNPNTQQFEMFGFVKVLPGKGE